MFDEPGMPAPIAGSPVAKLCSVEEIVGRIERRLAWYGLPRSRVRAVALDGTDHVIATVTVAGNGTFCEVFDRRTGCMRRRESLGRAA